MKTYLQKSWALWLIVFICWIAACTKGPTPDTGGSGSGSGSGGSGSGGSGSGGGSGGSGSGSGGGSGGSGSGTTNGVTLIRGTVTTTLFYNWTANGELINFDSRDGYASALRLTIAPSSPIRTKIINAELGSLIATPQTSNLNYTSYSISFSNINTYTGDTQISNPDTAGKVQIWTYREDGQDIIPASATRPAIKRIIQVIGTVPANVIGEGTIKLSEYSYPGYPAQPPAIGLASLQAIFSNARWSVNQFTWP